MVRSHQAVICAETAHVYTSECGAAEKHIGCKLLTVPSPIGKITVQGIREHLHHIGDEHHVQPRAISITQATEYGTVYTPQEIRVIADFAHANSLLLHIFPRANPRVSNSSLCFWMELLVRWMTESKQ